MTNTQPMVTIGIPTYNRADRTLRETLQSAVSQDYPNVEIVVSDNCSPDHTGDVVRSLADPRIQYVRQSVNLGPTGNYNACLAAARGDYFLLLHDDDLIDPDFVSTCLQAANHSCEYGVILTGTRMVDLAGKVLRDLPNPVTGSNPDDTFRAWVDWKTGFYLCSTLFNTGALRAIGGFSSPNNLFEDGFAIIKLSATHPILNVLECKASFRQHDEQRTFAQNPVHWYEDFRTALDLIYQQSPTTRADIYRTGLRAFAKTAFRFAFKVPSPGKRALAVFWVGKYYPTEYWPDVSGSWKLKLIRAAAQLWFRDTSLLRPAATDANRHLPS